MSDDGAEADDSPDTGDADAPESDSPDESGEGGGGDSSSERGEGGRGSLGEDSTLLSSEDVLKRGRELALQGVPLQLAGLFEALAKLRSRSQGSTASIFPAIIGQLDDLRSKYATASSALSKKFGAAGGGFTAKGKRDALASSGVQFANLLGGAQQQSFAGLLNVLGAVQPSLSGSARPPNVKVREGTPALPASLGEAVASSAEVFKRLFAATPSTTGVQAPLAAPPIGGTSVDFSQFELPSSTTIDMPGMPQ